MQRTVTFTSLDHLMDMPTYGKLCGIDSRAVQKRIREKKVAYVVADGNKLIDINASPPTAKLPRKFRNQAIADTEGVRMSDLVNVGKLAAGKRITVTRFYRAILLGKLSAVHINGQFYIRKSDAAFAEVLHQK